MASVTCVLNREYVITNCMYINENSVLMTNTPMPIHSKSQYLIIVSYKVVLINKYHSYKNPVYKVDNCNCNVWCKLQEFPNLENL